MSIVAVVPMPVVRIGHVDVRMIERVVNMVVDVRFTVRTGMEADLQTAS